jgi:hypothetical protein
MPDSTTGRWMQLTSAGTCSSLEPAIAGVPLKISRNASAAVEMAVGGNVRILMECCSAVKVHSMKMSIRPLIKAKH